MKVRATRMGYRNHIRIRPGTVFHIDEKSFSKNWMEKLDAVTVTEKAKFKKKEKELAEVVDQETDDVI